MLIDLSKKDLVSLVCGTPPYYALFSHFLIKPYGSYNDNKGWLWDKTKLKNELSEQSLYDIYNLCTDSWIFFKE